jgi:3-isopropylmalate dehydratase small subunit
VTVAYNSRGTELWVARYPGPGDGGRAIAVDDITGNIYVTGTDWAAGTGNDYKTLAYDSTGKQLWAARYNGPSNWSDIAVAIAVDPTGNVYVTGASTGQGSGFDYATVAYDSSTGAELWVSRYNGPANNDDFGQAIALDSFGNIYVTGNSWGIGTFTDYATVAYDSTGAELWVARYDGPASSYDAAHAIAVDSTGNVYVTGESPGTGSDYDYATVAYDSAGAELWVARYNGPANSADYGRAIALDSLGNIYVTGNSLGIGSGYDYATVAYDSAGTELWVARYNGPANGWDTATAIAVDTAGSVYVTGTSNATVGNEYATIKYSQP